jgi:hypothetical protein
MSEYKKFSQELCNEDDQIAKVRDLGKKINFFVTFFNVHRILE